MPSHHQTESGQYKTKHGHHTNRTKSPFLYYGTGFMLPSQNTHALTIKGGKTSNENTPKQIFLKKRELTKVCTTCLLYTISQESQLSRKIECSIPIIISENPRKRTSQVEKRNLQQRNKLRAIGFYSHILYAETHISFKVSA